MNTRSDTDIHAEGRPLLSVVVAAGELRDRAAGCLSSLLSQRAADRLEILLLDLAPDLGPIAGSEHPAVRVMPLPAGTTFAAARAIGVRAARAERIAFLEEHVRALPGWAEEVLAAFDAGFSGVGPCFIEPGRGPGCSEAAGAMGYGLFYPPLVGGEVAMIAGHNSSYRRDALLALGDELDRLLACDMVLMQRLRERGQRLGLAPRAVVEHLNEVRVAGVARGYFHFHRIYGHQRSRAWTPLRRLAYVVLAPLIPVYFVVLFHARQRRRRPDLARVLWRHLPSVLTVQLAGALGQALGILRGTGDAERRFTHYELTEPRAASRGGS